MNINKIKILSESKGILLKDLAESIGMSYQNLNRCVRENKIMANDLEKIASALGVPVSYFFEETGSVPAGLLQGCATPPQTADFQKQIIALQAENSRLKDRIIELQDKMYQLKTK